VPSGVKVHMSGWTPTVTMPSTAPVAASRKSTLPGTSSPNASMATATTFAVGPRPAATLFGLPA
jgi:hypothetical protein